MEIREILQDSAVDEINILTGGMLIVYSRTSNGWEEVDADIPHIINNDGMYNIVSYYVLSKGARVFRRDYLDGTRITIACNIGEEIQ